MLDLNEFAVLLRSKFSSFHPHRNINANITAVTMFRTTLLRLIQLQLPPLSTILRPRNTLSKHHNLTAAPMTCEVITPAQAIPHALIVATGLFAVQSYEHHLPSKTAVGVRPRCARSKKD